MRAAGAAEIDKASNKSGVSKWALASWFPLAGRGPVYCVGNVGKDWIYKTMCSVSDLLSPGKQGTCFCRPWTLWALELSRMRSASGFGITFRSGRSMEKSRSPGAKKKKKKQLDLLAGDGVRRDGHITGQQL